MAINYLFPEFEVHRDPNRCICCRVCERQCSNSVHHYDAEAKIMLDGSTIKVNNNAQDETGDTMNDGEIFIHGNCGDAAGYAMNKENH